MTVDVENCYAVEKRGEKWCEWWKKLSSLNQCWWWNCVLKRIERYKRVDDVKVWREYRMVVVGEDAKVSICVRMHACVYIQLMDVEQRSYIALVPQPNCRGVQHIITFLLIWNNLLTFIISPFALTLMIFICLSTHLAPNT